MVKIIVPPASWPNFQRRKRQGDFDHGNSTTAVVIGGAEPACHCRMPLYDESTDLLYCRTSAALRCAFKGSIGTNRTKSATVPEITDFTDVVVVSEVVIVVGIV